MKYFVAVLLLAAAVSIIFSFWRVKVIWKRVKVENFSNENFDWLHRFLALLNGKFKRPKIWIPIVQSAPLHWAFPKTRWMNTKNGTSPTTRRHSATSSAFSKRWDSLMRKTASMWIIWWNNWDKARTKPLFDQKLSNVPIKIHRKQTLANGHTAVLTASKKHTWTWFKPASRRTKSATSTPMIAHCAYDEQMNGLDHTIIYEKSSKRKIYQLNSFLETDIVTS